MRCPFCAEEIQDDAVKCRYCREWLPGKIPPELQTGDVTQTVLPVADAKASPRAFPRTLLIWLAVAVAVLVIASQMFGNGGTSGSDDYIAPVTQDYGPRTVVYSVEGDGTSSASLTYENGSGGTQQEKVSLPWEKTITASEGDFVYISAQNQNDYGDLSVKITVDDTPFKLSKASGGYTIATASGSCP